MSAIQNTVDKVKQSGFPLSLKSTSPEVFPIAYDDNIWDIVTQDSSMYAMMGSEGSFTQHDINEEISKRIFDSSTSVESIAEEVRKIDASLNVHEDRLDVIDSSISGIENAVSSLDSSVTGVETRLVNIDSSIAGIESSIHAIDGSIAGIDTHLTQIDSSVSGITSSINAIDSSISGIESSIHAIDGSIAGIETHLTSVDSSISGIESSIHAIDGSIAGIENHISTIDSSIGSLATSKIDKPSSAVSGNVAVFDANKNVIDSGKTPLEIGDASTNAYRGDRGKTAYEHSQLISGNPHHVTANDVGLGSVGNYKAVSVDASQGLTTTEQSNARANIGAADSSQGEKADTIYGNYLRCGDTIGDVVYENTIFNGKRLVFNSNGIVTWTEA